MLNNNKNQQWNYLRWGHLPQMRALRDGDRVQAVPQVVQDRRKALEGSFDVGFLKKVALSKSKADLSVPIWRKKTEFTWV